jgi:hypothetical protein
MINVIATSGAELVALVAGEIETGDFTQDTRDRLRPCLNTLRASLAEWQSKGCFGGPGLLAACATPKSAAVIHSSHWGKGVDGLNRREVSNMLLTAIEQRDPPLIAASITAFLGEDGRNAVEAAAREIELHGGQPLVIVLAATTDSNDVAMLVATGGVSSTAPPPSLMVH